jgi:hypothetical protein
MRRYRESKMMSRMRFLPQLIDTLEKRIEQDKEALQEIRIRMLEGKKTLRMKNKETLLSARIEQNRSTLQKLHMEKVNIAQQLNDMIII